MESSTERLIPLMAHAMDGDGRALREFYHLLLSYPFFVPKRHQQRPLSDAPDYPNNLIDVLGVRGSDRVVVPIFSSQEIIERWCGVALEARELKFQDLLLRIPDGWWVVINPGQEVEKEISPWELEHLKHGERGIAEILDDQDSEGQSRGLQIEPVLEGEFPKLLEAGKQFLETQPEVDSIYWLKEQRLNREGEKESIVLLALEGVNSRVELEPLSEKFARLAHRAMIGDTPIRVLANDQTSQAFISQVMSRYPCLVQRNDLWSRLCRMLRERRSRA